MFIDDREGFPHVGGFAEGYVPCSVYEDYGGAGYLGCLQTLRVVVGLVVVAFLAAYVGGDSFELAFERLLTVNASIATADEGVPSLRVGVHIAVH